MATWRPIRMHSEPCHHGKVNTPMTTQPAQLDPIDRIAAQARIERTPCGDGSVVWRVWGSGPALVLLHGGHGSWTHWIANIEALSRTHTLWVPDMPGYGDSAMPEGAADPASIAAPLVEGLDALLGAASCDLVGFSFGGVVAGFVQARFERVGMLVLVGAGGLGLRFAPVELRAWRSLDDAHERDAAHRHNLRALMLADAASVDALALRVQRDNTARARIESRRASRTDALARILEQTRPALAGIWGEDDALVRGKLADVQASLRAVYPEAHLHRIERAGHWVQYEQPRAFEQALLAALARRG